MKALLILVVLFMSLGLSFAQDTSDPRAFSVYHTQMTIACGQYPDLLNPKSALFLRYIAQKNSIPQGDTAGKIALIHRIAGDLGIQPRTLTEQDLIEAFRGTIEQLQHEHLAERAQYARANGNPVPRPPSFIPQPRVEQAPTANDVRQAVEDALRRDAIMREATR